MYLQLCNVLSGNNQHLYYRFKKVPKKKGGVNGRQRSFKIQEKMKTGGRVLTGYGIY